MAWLVWKALTGLAGGTFAGGLVGGTRLLRLGKRRGVAAGTFTGGLAGGTGLLRLGEDYPTIRNHQ